MKTQKQEHSDGKESKMTDHTPTPWKFTHHTDIGGDQMARIDDADGMFIAGVSDKNLVDHARRDADAAFIVRAVNSHEELLQALKQTLDALYNETAGETQDTPWIESVKQNAKAIIAKAEGK